MKRCAAGFRGGFPTDFGLYGSDKRRREYPFLNFQTDEFFRRSVFLADGKICGSEGMISKKTGTGKEIPAPVSDNSRPQQYKYTTSLFKGKPSSLKFVVEHNKRFTF